MPKSKQKSSDSKIVQLRLPDEVMVVLAHASLLSNQPVEVIVNVLLAMQMATIKNNLRE